MLGKQCVVAPDFLFWYLQLALFRFQEFGIITVGVDYRNFPRPSVKMAQGDKVWGPTANKQIDANSVKKKVTSSFFASTKHGWSPSLFHKRFSADKKQLVLSCRFHLLCLHHLLFVKLWNKAEFGTLLRRKAQPRSHLYRGCIPDMVEDVGRGVRWDWNSAFNKKTGCQAARTKCKLHATKWKLDVFFKWPAKSEVKNQVNVTVVFSPSLHRLLPTRGPSERSSKTLSATEGTPPMHALHVASERNVNIGTVRSVSRSKTVLIGSDWKRG